MTQTTAVSNGQVTGEVTAAAEAVSNGQADEQADGQRRPDKLKLCEMVEVEAKLERHVLEDLMTGLPGVDLMQALLWIVVRRANPDFTFEEAGECDSDNANERFGKLANADDTDQQAEADLTGISLDTGKLKYREMGEIESCIGRRISADLMTGVLGGDMLQAMVWLRLRDTKPGFTFEDAGEFRTSQVLPLLVPEELEGDAVDPQPARDDNKSSDKPPARKSSKRSRSSATSTG